VRLRFVLATALLTLGGLAACGQDEPKPLPSPSSAPPPAVGEDNARTDLVARAALAMDKSYAALYSLDDGSGAPRDVVATIGADGTWRIDVAKGAFGGTTDESIVSTPTGMYQCTVTTAANPITPACVKVAKAGKPVPNKYDPRVERLFWPALAVFTDRQAAIAVTEVEPLTGAKGDCYSIDSISASLPAPVDIGIYCYSADGVLTAVRVGFGVLKLVSQVPGPKTVPLPGAVVDETPMETASPEPPPSVPSSSGLPSSA
jgi:predicted small lipoprotein YifL